MIIGIVGLIGSGKDTIADYLVNIHQFRRDSFAAPLKDAVAQVFGWPRDLLEGRTRYSREWREQVDAWWSHRLGMPHLTPRWILQHWGTEVCRGGFHDDIWVASLEHRIKNTQDDVVITDCRFPNEIAAIRGSGGLVIRVRRGPDPDWFLAAQHSLRNHLPPPLGLPHASEWAWAGTHFDAVVSNDGSMDDLYRNINDLVQDHHAARADHHALSPSGSSSTRS